MESILIIEDDPDTLSSMAEFLQGESYNTFQAENKRVGLILAKKQAPDLILCDLRLPEGDEGFEILAELRKNKATSPIPFIFLTSSQEDKDIVKAFELGAQDYIVKTASPGEILARVKTHLELKRLRTELECKNQDLEKKTIRLTQLNNLLQEAQNFLDKFKEYSSEDHRVKSTSISGNAEFLQKKIANDDKILERLETIIR